MKVGVKNEDCARCLNFRHHDLYCSTRKFLQQGSTLNVEPADSINTV